VRSPTAQIDNYGVRWILALSIKDLSSNERKGSKTGIWLTGQVQTSGVNNINRKYNEDYIRFGEPHSTQKSRLLS
jgi:hypothetical protein